MRVVGPDWESTKALSLALAPVAPLDYTLRWGRRAWNGWEQLCKFADAGILCPDACNTLAEASACIRELWGRKLLHTQGRDIVSEIDRRWNKRDYWVVPIEIAEEYRQHVWDGKCIRIGRKIQTEPATQVLPIRSRRNGWTIDYGAKAAKAIREDVRNAAKAACAALGYVGGAVDLVQGTDGKVYVLEVNTAPSLRDENTLGAYVKAISEWAGGRNARLP